MVILVHGSINIDQFFTVSSIVAPGQTIHSTSSSQRAGGKGANTAVAIAKAGQQVEFAGTTGQDGLWLRKTLLDHGVSIATLLLDGTLPTGKAFIQVAENGDNSIVLDAGANGRIYDLPPTSYAHPACEFGGYSHVVCQNEIPYAATVKTLRTARSRAATTIFNPSPMLTRAQIRKMDWDSVDYLVLNEGEADELLRMIEEQYRWEDDHDDESQIRPPLKGFARFRQIGLKTSTIIVTKGSEGADVLIGDEILNFPLKVEVNVADTTGAGDCFVGYFCASLAAPDPSVDSKAKVSRAVDLALAAASMSCESDGAMDSYPSIEELEARTRRDY